MIFFNLYICLHWFSLLKTYLQLVDVVWYCLILFISVLLLSFLTLFVFVTYFYLILSYPPILFWTVSTHISSLLFISLLCTLLLTSFFRFRTVPFPSHPFSVFLSLDFSSFFFFLLFFTTHHFYSVMSTSSPFFFLSIFSLLFFSFLLFSPLFFSFFLFFLLFSYPCLASLFFFALLFYSLFKTSGDDKYNWIWRRAIP